jgi:hypothetical protein
MITNRTTPIPITVALLISFDSVSAVMKKTSGVAPATTGIFDV